MTWREQFTLWFEQFLGIPADIQWKILLCLLIWTGTYLFRRILLGFVFRFVDQIPKRYRWKKISYYLLILLNMAAFARIWIAHFEAFATFFGLLSAGLAIALKEPLTNMAAWLLIIVKRPLEGGDRVQIGQIKGDVIDISLFQISMIELDNWVEGEQSTGRIIHVPTGRIFTDSVANYSRGFLYIWDELHLTVTFESDWRKAKALLSEILTVHAKNIITEEKQKELENQSIKNLISYQKLTPIVYMAVKEHGVQFSLRYLCLPKQRRNSQESLWEQILTRFEQEKNIALAYKTNRLFVNHLEGKSALRP